MTGVTPHGTTRAAARRLAAIVVIDVVGYSRLMGEDEEGTLRRLQALRGGIIEPLVATHRGRVFKLVGDGLLVEFGSAVDAVTCGAAIQHSLASAASDGASLALRIGVHLGDVLVDGDDLYGDGVNVAARLEGLADPGGMCVSDVVHEQVQRRVSLHFRDLGERRLRNIANPLRAWAWSAGWLPTASHRVVTPAANELLGRTRDLSDALAALGRARVLTVVGPGGMGKTSLARVVARESAGAMEVVWAELAAVSEVALLPVRIIESCGLEPEDVSDPLAVIATHFGSGPSLLILDNAEHLLDAVAALVPDLVQRLPFLRVLVTSQAPLRIRGEEVLRLEALEVPAASATVDQAASTGAIALFCARLRASGRRFDLDETTLPLVRGICARLDGIPLALELAAARAGTLGLSATAKRLDESLRLLKGGSRDLPKRQQAMSAVFDWSVGLLSEAHRAVFFRIGCLAGGFTLEEASAQCVDIDHDGTPLVEDEWAAFEAITELVHRSLVRLEDGDPPRYSLLESARNYALEQLLAGGGEAYLLRAADACAERGRASLDAASGVTAMQHLSAALDLVKRLPPGPTRTEREVQIGLDLGPALQATLGPAHPRCEELYRRCIELSGAAGPGRTAFKALWGYWQFLSLAGRDREAVVHADAIVAMARELQDDGLTLEALHASMTTRDLLGDSAAVLACAAEIGARYRREHHHALTFEYGGHDPGVCALGQEALNLWLSGHADAARKKARAGLDLANSLDHGYTRATAAFYAALTFAGCGDTDDLERTAQRLSLLCDEHGMELLETEGVLFRGRAAWERGHSGALEQMQGALQTLEESADLGFVFIYASWVAEALHAAGDVAALRDLLDRMVRHARLGQALFLPEMHRWRGELAVLEGALHDAVTAFTEARELAVAQGSVALGLRAGLSALRAGDGAAAAAVREDLARVVPGGETRDTCVSSALLVVERPHP